MTDLLPCPFCGHIGLYFNEGSTFRWLAYSCGGCGIGSETRVQTMGKGTNEEWLEAAKVRAVGEWNTRVFAGVKNVSSDHSSSMPPLLPGDL